MLFDPARLVDQSLENAAHRVRVERVLRLAAQAIEHFAFAIGVIDGDAVLALVLADGQDDSHALRDQFEDATIQVIDASTQLFELRSRLHERDRNIRQSESQRTTVLQPERTWTFSTLPELRVLQAAPSN